MKYLYFGLIVLFGLSLCSANQRRDQHRSALLKHNKTPKEASSVDAVDAILIRGAAVGGDLDDSNTVCDDCVRVINILKGAVHDARKLDEIKVMLKMMCDMLSGEQVQECKSFIDNLDTIIDQLDPYLNNPRLLCQQLELCGDSATDLPRIMQLALRMSRKYLSNQKDDIVCDECVFVMQELKSVMQDKSAKDEVRSIFEQICGYLGGSTAQQCTGIVDQYFPFIWDELVSLLSDARGVCMDLELCQKQSTSRRTSMMRLVPALRREFSNLHSSLPEMQTTRLQTAVRFFKNLQTRSGDNVNCVMCEIGWTGIIDYLSKNNATLDKLTDGVRNYVCQKVMPTSFADGCDDFLSLYLKSVMLMTLSDVTPREICDAIHACTSAQRRRLERMTRAQKSVVVCEACTVATEFLQHEIRDRTVQSDLKQMVERACQQLSGDMRAECTSMIDTYLPAIFDSLVDELNPETICPQLGLCSARLTMPIREGAANNDV